MSKFKSIGIVVALAVVVGVVVAAKMQPPASAPTTSSALAPTAPAASTLPTPPVSPAPTPQAQASPTPAPPMNPASSVPPVPVPAPLPKLIDLGAGKCIPCKAMAPILDELKQTYAGRFEVEFIDVWVDQSAGERYGIRMIPTQIFFDAKEKELFRHEGFFSRQDILGVWKQLGFNFDAAAPAPTATPGKE